VEKTDADPGDDVLELTDVHARNQRGMKALDGINLLIRSSEILGIAGVAGNGQDELAEVITGLINPSQGKIFLNGKDVTQFSPLGMIKEGVSFIPADRIGMGTVGDMAVAENLAMKGYRNEPINEKGVLRPNQILKFAKRLIGSFNIITPNPYTHIKFLSGGNIQKAILAREIDCCSHLMIAMYPSRGLDVGATESVRKLLIEQRNKDVAVLLISEDLDELLSISDRIAVLFNGKIMGIVDSNEAAHDKLGLMMAGVPLDELEEA
jgi:general nucleoside transport system ATP-binding protein